jgi:hypothetical protein
LTINSIDLPPTTIAKPLPVSKSAAANGVFTTELSNTRRGKKRKRTKDDADDTPKAFLRLMAFQSGKKLPKGLDDGVRITKAEKKRKIAVEKIQEENNDVIVEKEKDAEKVEMPTIRPGEKMSEFSARVDAALPVSGLINKTSRGGKDPLGLKVGRTKKEKKMHKLYDQWREEEKKIQEKKMEEEELREEEEMEEDESGRVRWKSELEGQRQGQGKKKGKGKKKRVLGEVEDGEDDPWEKIKRNRGEGKVAFGDVVLAPPTFTKLPKEKFKVRGARVEVEDVPKASGSLRRREELSEVRKSVVEGYRAMMKANKAKS